MAHNVESIMRTKVATCKKDVSVHDACLILRQYNTSTVVIVDDERQVIGVFSERDLVNRVVADSLDPRRVKVEEVMTAPAICAEMSHSDVQLTHLIISNHVKKIPVTDEGKLVGIVADSDLLKHFAAKTLNITL